MPLFAFLLLLLSTTMMRMARSMASTSTKRQIALVTGANRGIGKEVCRQLADQGYHVILAARDLTKGQAAADELLQTCQADGESLPRIVPAQLDVTDPKSVQDLSQRMEQQYGVLDVLVNNAGINYDSWQRTISVDLDDVKETMETNLYGPWRLSMALLPLLQKSTHFPRIVNVSSGAGSLTGMSGGTPAYGVSKAALNALTLKLAAELPNVRVNAVCPGWIATDMGGAGGAPVPQGAASVVWAATLDQKEAPTGGFFRNGKAISW